MVTYISLWKKWKERRKGLKQEAVGNQEKQELRMKMWSAAKIPEVRTAPLQLAFSWEKRRAALVILLGKEQASSMAIQSQLAQTQVLALPLNVLWAYMCASVVSDSLWLYEPQTARLLCPCDSPGKNTGVVCHALLQGIFPTQGSNPWHWQEGSLPLVPPGKPPMLYDL